MGKEGMTPARLLQQANRVLCGGRSLVIESASFENTSEATVPNRAHFAELMTQHGFDTVVEVSQYHHFGEDKKEQKVVYYGRKTAEGFDASRSQVGSTKTKFDSQTGRLVRYLI
jgi:hypothetical protein